mgnify:CR=1 FL=1
MSKIVISPVGHHVRTLAIQDYNKDVLLFVVTITRESLEELARQRHSGQIEIPLRLAKSDVHKIAAWTKAG